MNPSQTTPIIFNGKTSEYFGIWIVNVLLSIVTLGIYSAWAKIRKKKYFYNNTLIDNVGFDYHANPIAILKGRIIAFVFFVAYAASQHVHPFLPLLFLLVFFAALPWLVVRASIFNARNTSHRGLRFDFIGKVGDATWAFFILPIITLLTLGLGAPYSSQQKHKFLVEKHTFGASPFSMQATGKDFYKEYLIFSGVTIAITLVIVVPLLIFCSDMLKGVGFGWATQMPGADKTAGGLLFVVIILFYLLLALCFGSFLQARIGNLVWNNTTLGKLTFQSNLRVRDFLWLYITNLLAIACSFGLATPWAQIRMVKYRTEKLQVLGEVNFEQFVGTKKADAKAMGEEIADMFDVDLSFG